jgi:hypothetical protein
LGVLKSIEIYYIITNKFLKNMSVTANCFLKLLQGRTTAYAKSGYKVATFQSKFPGGNSASYKGTNIKFNFIYLGSLKKH